MNVLPENDAERGEILMADCLLDYFPNALAAVAVHSKRGNDKHNPGESAHWARDKSTDHRNKIMRHVVDAGGTDKNGDRHSAALAWRALALLEDELIAAGAVPGRNAIGAPAPKEHRRVATPAEMAAYRDNGRRCDSPGFVLRTGDTVRIVTPSPGDVKSGWRAGQTAKVAHVHGGVALLQDGPAKRWFAACQFEWVRA